MLRVGFILCALSLATTSWAENLGIVALAPADTPIARAELERAIRLAAAGAGHQVVLDPIALARGRSSAGAVLRERLGPFSRAEELVADGWKSYAQVQMAVAKARIAEAREAAMAVADLDGGVALVAETVLRLGVIEFELGEVDESAADFRLANRLAPDRAVTDDEFKPAVVTAFRAALAEPTVKRPVVVNLSPAAAAIEIDGTGRPAGDRLELEVGSHLVVIRAPGMASRATVVSVPRAGEAVINETLVSAPATAGLFAGDVEVSTSAAASTRILESAALFSDLDGVLVVASAWRDREGVLVAQKCAGLPLRCTRVVEVAVPVLGALAVASSELLTRIDSEPRSETDVLVPSDSRVVTSAAPIEKPPIVYRRPWWKNPWLWVGVGAAVAVVGTTAIIIAIDPDSPLGIVTDPCQFGSC